MLFFYQSKKNTFEKEAFMCQSQNIRDAFPFIKRILSSAFRADVIWFSYPYENIRKIDWGFRDMVWENVDFLHPAFTRGASSGKLNMYIVKSSLDFYNIIAFITTGERPEFISVGPVRDKDSYSLDIRRLQKNHTMRDVRQETLRHFYQMLPMVNIPDLVSTLHHLLEEYLPAYRDIRPEYVNFSAEKHAFVPDSKKMLAFSYEVTERLQRILGTFLDTLSTGDTALVYRHKKALLNYFGPMMENNLGAARSYLTFLNALCCGRLLETQVHPYHTMKLFSAWYNRIAELQNPEQAWMLPYEMARKYCLLAKNHNHSEYSCLTRGIINYVSLHLGEELTLSVISGYLGKNPSYVSGHFQKEMGESLTEYIHRERIQTSIRLFNTTNCPVAEAASNVGIHDLGYFTRLFKKYVGCTPSQYKKMLK